MRPRILDTVIKNHIITPRQIITHIEKMNNLRSKQDKDGKIAYLFEDHVWCEVEYSNTVDYSALVYQNGINKNGVYVPKNAYMKEVPLDGFYNIRQIQIKLNLGLSPVLLR